MFSFRVLDPDENLPDDDCIVIEFVVGHYFVNGYVRTSTGGYSAAFSPMPYERQGDAIEAALDWAKKYRLSEVLSRGWQL